jgi:hypothetical protein
VSPERPRRHHLNRAPERAIPEGWPSFFGESGKVRKMKMKTRNSLRGLAVFRIDLDDKEQLHKIAEKCDLNESEVGRRALRLGLRILEDTELPGSRSSKNRK